MQFLPNSAPFYVNAATEVVVDPLQPPTAQSTLLRELKKCEDLVQRDYRYAHLVAGASKMPMPMVWAVRNQDEVVNDMDLAMFKDIAWNEFVKKRFLPTVSESSVCESAASMLEIVRGMNLQRRRFQIMGLHEQVEASEIQLVLHLCQAGIVRINTTTALYRRTANRFRRSDRLYEAFALAVGASVCATAPLTLGAATARYERDLQYEYRKNSIALFVYVLQKNPGWAVEDGLDDDYVARIARMIVVSPSSPCARVAGPASSGGGGGDDGDDDKYARLANAVAIAQNSGKDAVKEAHRLQVQVAEHIAQNNTNLGLGRAELRGMMDALRTAYTRDLAAVQAGMGHFEATVNGQLVGMSTRLDGHADHTNAWRQEMLTLGRQIKADATATAAQMRTDLVELVRQAVPVVVAPAPSSSGPAGLSAAAMHVDIAKEVSDQVTKAEQNITSSLSAAATAAVNALVNGPGGLNEQLHTIRTSLIVPQPVAAGGGMLPSERQELVSLRTSLNNIVAGLRLDSNASNLDALVVERLNRTTDVVEAVAAGLGMQTPQEIQTRLFQHNSDLDALRRGLGVTQSDDIRATTLRIRTEVDQLRTDLGTANTAAVTLNADVIKVGGSVGALKQDVDNKYGSLRSAGSVHHESILDLEKRLKKIEMGLNPQNGSGPIRPRPATPRGTSSTADVDAKIGVAIQAAGIDGRIAAAIADAVRTADIDGRIANAITATDIAGSIANATANLDGRIRDAVTEQMRQPLADLAAYKDALDQRIPAPVAGTLTSAEIDATIDARIRVAVEAAVRSPPPAAASPDIANLTQTVQHIQEEMVRLFGDVNYHTFSMGVAPDAMTYAPPRS